MSVVNCRTRVNLGSVTFKVKLSVVAGGRVVVSL